MTTFILAVTNTFYEMIMSNTLERIINASDLEQITQLIEYDSPMNIKIADILELYKQRKEIREYRISNSMIEIMIEIGDIGRYVTYCIYKVTQDIIR